LGPRVGNGFQVNGELGPVIVLLGVDSANQPDEEQNTSEEIRRSAKPGRGTGEDGLA